jgi:hypothetical protein
MDRFAPSGMVIFECILPKLFFGIELAFGPNLAPHRSGSEPMSDKQGGTPAWDELLRH